jgi:transcriptional regulator with XRE-family HTH domain
MDVPSALRQAREQAGLTQAELAELAGTSQATVSAYESGRKEPSVNTLSRLLAAAGARLTVEPGTVRVPSRIEQERAGRTLAEVIALAEALPARRKPKLRYPRLAA